MKVLIGIAVFAGLIVTRAFAADMPVKASPPSPGAAFNWNGFYVGGNIGYGWGGNTGAGWTSFTDPGAGFGTAAYFAAGGNALPAVNPKGVIGGGQVGYDWQSSPTIVLGLVTDLNGSSIKDAASASVKPGVFASSVQSNAAQIKSLGTARAKVGFASNNWLIYGTGGLAYGRVSEQNVFNCTGCGASIWNGSNSATKTGWTLSAGLEYGLTSNWIVGAEYLYFDLGKIAATAIQGAVPGVTFTSNAKFDGSIARAFINYKFN